MKLSSYLIFGLIMVFGLFACEEEYTPDNVGEIDDIVVEGYIEAGPEARPVFVLLTKALPFFSELAPSDFGGLYVKGAEVTVTDDLGRKVRLSEICWEDLDPLFRELVAQELGLPSADIAFDLCAYVDAAGEIEAREGGSYQLDINAEGKDLRALTTIPPHIPLDSLWFEVPRGEPNDTMAELWCTITDPALQKNYYRYLTATNGGRLIAGFQTVTDDAFFDGMSFDFPLTKSEDPNDDLDPAVFGLFRRGDTARIKWLNLDEAHYNFWLTLETARSRQGPFSSYVRIASNVQGGLGIWGGYSVSYYDLVVPPL